MAEWYEKKMGPLPIGAWALVLAAGLAVSYWLSRKAGTSDNLPPEIVEDVSNVPGVGAGAAGWSYVPPPAPTPEDEIDSNEEWGQAAIDEMIARNYDPVLVDRAIRKYLSGEALNIAEETIVQFALRILGSPPYPLPPPRDKYRPKEPTKHENKPPKNGGKKPPKKGSKKPPAHPIKTDQDRHPDKKRPKPKNKGPKYRHYTVRRGDTLWDIADKFLGRPQEWRKIYNLNRGKVNNPDLIFPGQKLRIPKR